MAEIIISTTIIIKMVRDIELLAPAGNKEALFAAVQSGADAVYIGGPCFNARQSAKNFTIDEIKECADYCHIYGADLHVAVNTLMKENELRGLKDYAIELNNAGVDALIIQDIGAARIIRSICPKLSLHASTQMTVTSIEGVKYLENMGFSRVVLARELSRDEIYNISKNTKAELEVFVHGALCMCYSGQCLMSSILGGRSANRGRCAQPCRLPYTLVGNNEKISAYALSPKDLALIDELNELKKIGVASLKIEGRLKRAEYVSAVTGIYRKYLDSGKSVTKEDFNELYNAFSRSGFTKGYFKNEIGRKMMSHKTSSNVSDNVFSDEARARTRENANFRKISIDMFVTIHENDPVSLTIIDKDGNSVTTEGTLKAERAINRPLDKDRLFEQLKKLGDTPYVLDNAEFDVDEDISIAIKEINSVRREACEELTAVRQQRASRAVTDKEINKKRTRKREKVCLTAECETLNQAKECIKSGIDILYVPQNVADKLNPCNSIIVTKAPDIFSAVEIQNKNVTVSSPAQAMYYKDKNLYATSRLNVYNSETADEFSYMKLINLSPELNLHETTEIINNTDAMTEITGYGRITLMLMKNCPIKAMGKCGEHKNIYKLRDRKNEEFPVLCSPDCRARLINSKPIFMADKIRDLLNTGADAIKLVFTIEDEKLTGEIVRLYKSAVEGNKVSNIFKENQFTRGHYFRGVE